MDWPCHLHSGDISTPNMRDRMLRIKSCTVHAHHKLLSPHLPVMNNGGVFAQRGHSAGTARAQHQLLR